ncbi:MAG: enoyl-CoA hydratase/isomerase family protein [Alphaproteobacteria bacterium]|nr:enoyl-CoA hydratase/isomerase family protein [Alphaproteobacteria bacterium]
MTDAVRLEREGNIAVVTIDNPPVNAGSIALRQGLIPAFGKVAGDKTVIGAVLIGAGRTFVAGSDIREFGKPLADPQLPAVIAAIEECPKPVIVAIHGAALGGGYELALGCDIRIATPDAKLGLPEVTLGMIPGAGGTVRLPRIVDPAEALDIVVTGKRVPAPEALKLGMIDAVTTGDLRAAAIELARSPATAKRRLRDLPVRNGDPARFETAANAALKRNPGRKPVTEPMPSRRPTTPLPSAKRLAPEPPRFRNCAKAMKRRPCAICSSPSAKAPRSTAARPTPGLRSAASR